MIAHTILEVGCGDFLLINCPGQVAHSMNECVLVPDDVSRRPPRFNVRMAGIGNEYGFEAAVRALFDVELKLVEALKIKSDAALTAIDFKPQMVLMPKREARSFDTAESAVFKLHQ